MAVPIQFQTSPVSDLVGLLSFPISANADASTGGGASAIAEKKPMFVSGRSVAVKRIAVVAYITMSLHLSGTPAPPFKPVVQQAMGISC